MVRRVNYGQIKGQLKKGRKLSTINQFKVRSFENEQETVELLTEVDLIRLSPGTITINHGIIKGFIEATKGVH